MLKQINEHYDDMLPNKKVVTEGNPTLNEALRHLKKVDLIIKEKEKQLI